MFGAKSTILVSVSISHENTQDEEQKHYLRPRHTWMISVQPHNHLISGHHKTTEIAHYTSFLDTSSGDLVVQETRGGSHGIVGNILLTSSAHASADEVLQLLQDRLHKGTVHLTLEVLSADEDSEAWARRALHTLQRGKVVEEFDVDEFMTFAQAYLRTRTDGDGSTAPAVVEYPRLVKEKAEGKGKGSGWRVSYPNQVANQNGDRLYGGLM